MSPAETVKRVLGYIETLAMAFKIGARGSYAYYSLLAGLAVMAAYGMYVWFGIQHAPVFFGVDGGGLILTRASESMPWGIYIAFFIFWIGVAASAVIFTFAAYVFKHRAFKSLTVIAEAQAAVALALAVLGILAMLGRPDRGIVLLPQLPNLRSMLDWDFIVIFTYLGLNAIGYIYTLHKYRSGEELGWKFIVPFMIVSTPFAIGIHTVTAFIFHALTSKPIWNTAIMAPRFLATAFASGPAILLIVTYILEKTTREFRVDFDVYRKTMYVIVFALATALFFTFVEAHEIFWYTTEPMKEAQAEVLFLGKYWPTLSRVMWTWIALGVVGVLLSLVKRVRTSKTGIVLISVIAVAAVIAEKTMGTLIPGFIPDPLGRITTYIPTPTELTVFMGYHALLFLVYAILVKGAVKIMFSKEVGH